MPSGVTTRPQADDVPAEFAEATRTLHSARYRGEVQAEEMNPPRRIAPYACAVSAEIVVDDLDVGTGRLILLHDPQGNEAWAGTFRCVAYIRCDIDPEQITDPLLAEVGWSWLVEALETHSAEYEAASGTVTSVSSESFGSMSEDGSTAQMEIRASWTPTTTDLKPHAEAWGEVMCMAAGLPPVPEGVAVMPRRDNQG